MKLPLEGSCVCGSIRFEMSAEPLFTHACHCHSCQKVTGSAFAMSTFVLASDIQVTTGDAVAIDQPIKTGTRKVFLCPACMTVVWSESSDHANVRIIRPGVISNKSDIHPQAHIWVHRRQEWLLLEKNTPQFEGDYLRSETWPQSSLARISS